jgi:hypothetical protein
VRIRQIKPSFWEDAVIESLPDSVKLFYIGTWQLADDGGTFEWNVPEIGHALYGYQPRNRRERWVTERAAPLVGVGRLVIHECGHATVPNLLKHQRMGGTKAIAVSSAHLRCPPHSSAILRDPPRSSAILRTGKVEVEVEVEERVGGVRGGSSDDRPPLTADELAMVAMNQSILDNPKASPDAKRAARKWLMKLGVAA